MPLLAVPQQRFLQVHGTGGNLEATLLICLRKTSAANGDFLLAVKYPQGNLKTEMGKNVLVGHCLLSGLKFRIAFALVLANSASLSER